MMGSGCPKNAGPSETGSAPAVPKQKAAAKTIQSFYGISPLTTLKEMKKGACERGTESRDWRKGASVSTSHCEVQSDKQSIDLYFVVDPTTPAVNGHLAEITLTPLQGKDGSGGLVKAFFSAFYDKYGPLTEVDTPRGPAFFNDVQTCATGSSKCIQGAVGISPASDLSLVASYNAIDVIDAASNAATARQEKLDEAEGAAAVR
jgi:hypothetical protein